jgi:hypothetical protein
VLAVGCVRYGLCDELITISEESYRVCVIETPTIRLLLRQRKKIHNFILGPGFENIL